MNRNALNATTLGAGIIIPNKYWSATLDVIVMDSQAQFTQYVGVSAAASIGLSVSTAIDFVQTAAFFINAVFQVNPSVDVTRIQNAVSAVAVSITDVFNASVGAFQGMSSSLVMGAQTITAFTKTMYTSISQSIQDVNSATFGLEVRWDASQLFEDDIIAEFTEFGDYAPENRTAVDTTETQG